MNELNKEVYMIFQKGSSSPEGVYSRAYHNEYEFKSANYARNSNFHGIYTDTDKYKIRKYKVTYTLIEDDAKI